MAAGSTDIKADWVQGPWSVQLITVSSASYSRLRLESRSFPNWIISYVKEGDVETETGGETHRVKAGSVMLHPPHLPFSECAETKGTHLWMQTNIWFANHFDLFQLFRVSPVVAIPEPARYEAAFQRLLVAWDNQEGSFRDLRLTSAALQLMELIMAGWEQAGAPPRSAAFESSADRFARLIGMMSGRLHEKVSREELAADLRLNANYLDRAFAAQYGVTPMQMLRGMRLNRAKQLLERTDGTLEAIAESCGMTDASYLCKQFKSRFGMLPGEYRENYLALQRTDLYGARE
ncbi:AraC family transcriptional regulator [Paenibacillus sp. LHD-117]|uniref:AraC family transcriptional regulator n=1 Tax=Paenibacillus sp. LHD-117 TaxID=3071412 RepID=UPI0027E0F68F|nr:AraC family transcriptional regulator [Paenibacillus sp. LHD-117]MDQ6417809.1 AraC family transcriptional regulator [Paenibacillus sp. LHD-117]